MTNKQLANRLIDQGFDQTWIRQGVVHAACSRCEAAIINGTVCHEQNCQNARHICRGCNDLIPTNQRYCVDCV